MAAAIERALARDAKAKVDYQGIDECAAALVKAARDGDVVALRGIGDRLDGKATQQLNVTRADPFDELTVRHDEPLGDRLETQRQQLQHPNREIEAVPGSLWLNEGDVKGTQENGAR